MSRVRLASLLTLVLAFSGAWAMSSRVVESTRLVVSVAWLKTDQARPEMRHRLARWTSGPRVPVIGHETPAPVRPAALPHSLCQRPPPSS